MSGRRLSVAAAWAAQRAPFVLALAVLRRCPGVRVFGWLSTLTGAAFALALVGASGGPLERLHSLWRMAVLSFFGLTALVLASGLGGRLRRDALLTGDLLPRAGASSSIVRVAAAAAGYWVARLGLSWVVVWALSAASQAQSPERALAELGRAAGVSAFMCALGLALAVLMEASRRLSPHQPRRFAFGLLLVVPAVHAVWSELPSPLKPLLWLLDSGLAVS